MVYLLKMVIFHSYVKLPEGNNTSCMVRVIILHVWSVNNSVIVQYHYNWINIPHMNPFMSDLIILCGIRICFTDCLEPWIWGDAYHHTGVSWNGGSPSHHGFQYEYDLILDDLGYPHFRKPPPCRHHASFKPSSPGVWAQLQVAASNLQRRPILLEVQMV